MDGVDWLLITALDEVAWTLNLRGTDITYNPVFFSYLAFNPKTNKSILYINCQTGGYDLDDSFDQARHVHCYHICGLSKTS